jgi:hypothetical protein
MSTLNRRQVLTLAAAGLAAGGCSGSIGTEAGGTGPAVPDLSGAWDYRSFLVLPTDAELAGPPGTAVTARTWAKGSLLVPAGNGAEFRAELSFAPGVTLDLSGRIAAATALIPATLDATGEGLAGPTRGAVYAIRGWIVADGQQVRGSVLAVRGPAIPGSDPVQFADRELAGQPIGTVGQFVLTRAA